MRLPYQAIGLGFVCALALTGSSEAQPKRMLTTPTPQQWADLAKQPDLSGTWIPDENDQHKQTEGYRFGKVDKSVNPIPWNAQMMKLHNAQVDAFRTGVPVLVFFGCLPMGMPSLMLVSHNAMEFLPTPGRMTILGEGDGNRLRRIYMDGRGHPADPDLSFHGDSIGHWEGDTLVVDTVGVLPETVIAEGEGSGLPNKGGMHIVERIHLVSADELHDDLVIDAPKALSHPYQTTRTWRRERDAETGIQEGVCQQGEFREATDKYGNPVFRPAPSNVDGTVIPLKTTKSGAGK